MFIDKQNELSDAQDVTASAASTNTIDIGQTAQIGPGVRLRFRFKITETFDTLTNLTIALQGDTTAAFSSAATLATTGAITLASGGLAAGSEYTLTVPLSGVEQFIRAYYTVGGSDADDGIIDAFLEVYDAPEGDMTVIPGAM